jgi:DNA-3-methyladenine glycosylase II
VLGAVIARYPRGRLISRGEPFTTLARSIVGQQISVKAAETLWRRLEASLGRVEPRTLARADSETLRSAGMSRQKARYLNELGRRFAARAIDPARWRGMTDEDVIRDLTQVPGIGRWTSEMFLIFNLMRADVLPLGDIGLRRAVATHYGRHYPIEAAEVEAIAEAWRPWRSVATWYLWRSLDPLPVAY